MSENSSKNFVEKIKVNTNDWSFDDFFKNSPQIAIPIALIFVCVFSFIIFYVWRTVRIHRHKKSQLAALTSRCSNSQLYSGVKASQTIEFVVPTFTLKTNDPSFSATEESDSDCFMQFGYNSDFNERNRKRNSRININESEISKSLYDENIPKPLYRIEINFVLHYSFVRQQLLVTLLNARNLPQKRNNLNPFAKLVLLPEKNPKFVTKVQKNTTNPTFNELFIFQALRDTLDDRVLKITVYNSDSFSRKHIIGRTLFPLRTADIHSRIAKDVMTEDISCLLINSQPSGELLLSLTFDTNTSTLTLGTIKARNIFDKEIQTIYMKVVLFVKRKRIRSRKTTQRKVETEIEFNDIFNVNVNKESLNDIIISITVYGKSQAFTNKHLLGRTHVGQSCPSEQGKQHWDQMMDNLDKSVDKWHIIS